MNNKWQKGIDDLKNICLTKNEKDKVLQKVLTRSPYVSVKSPWIFEQFVTFRRHAVVFSAFLIVATSAGITFASEKSLPGNLLYSIKINITEPARDLIKVLPEKNIEWQAQKATRRLLEAEELLVQDKFDDKKRDEIESLFKKHTENFKKSSEREIEKIGVKEESAKIKNVEQTEAVEKKDVNKEETKKEKAETEIKEIEKHKKEARKVVEKRLEQLEKAREKAFENKDE